MNAYLLAMTSSNPLGVQATAGKVLRHINKIVTMSVLTLIACTRDRHCTISVIALTKILIYFFAMTGALRSRMHAMILSQWPYAPTIELTASRNVQTDAAIELNA